MNSQASQQDSRLKPQKALAKVRQIDAREWWLWAFAVAVTLVLLLGMISLTFPGLHFDTGTEWFDLKQAVRGLAGLVLLFDVYTLYQHFQLQRIRRQLAERDHLFKLITENAADLIAVVDAEGRRLYNSPAYQKVLGYSAEDLQTSSIEQIHPDDRPMVMEAAQKARHTGRGENLEYRIRHKDGSWRILESTASAVRNEQGETTSLVIVNRDITQRKRAEEMLAHNSFHDSLTDLPNRALFVDRLQHALLLAKRHANYKFAVLVIDVDEFKVFNDSLGHTVGDQLLIEIGRRLQTSLRGMDMISRPNLTKRSDLLNTDNTLARLGGDEFTVILDDIHDASDAVRVAQRIQEKWTAPFVINGQEVVITISIGIALNAATYASADDLLRDAEIAMYRAKHAGKAHYELFDPTMHAAAVQRLKLETDIRRALDTDEFKVYYQPIVSLQSGRILGFEALSRWQKPSGLVPPADFISVADETGLILPLNHKLMQDSARQLHDWQTQFPFDPPLTMSVNITAKQFANTKLAQEIGAIITQAGVPPQSFQLEITETITMADPARAQEVFSELKALGVRLSIDDFGTGYSSLSRLHSFPVDSLKIDRDFVLRMDGDEESREIVRVIVMLAHNLDLKVVAEGTETEDDVNFLKQLGCEMAQGYFFSRPTDRESISNLLSHFKWDQRAIGAAH
jgi:PAS domain S-box-containing protein